MSNRTGCALARKRIKEDQPLFNMVGELVDLPEEGQK